MNQQICFIYSQDLTRRLVVFRRREGGFGVLEQYHFDNEEADIQGWASLPPHPSIYADKETAKREAVVSVRWPLSEAGFVDAEQG